MVPRAKASLPILRHRADSVCRGARKGLGTSVPWRPPQNLRRSGKKAHLELRTDVIYLQIRPQQTCGYHHSAVNIKGVHLSPLKETRRDEHAAHLLNSANPLQ